MKPVYARYRVALEEIAAKNEGGKLIAAEVVELARDPSHPLHGYFDWDDTEAANKWRLVQARNLIRFIVEDRDEVDAQPMHIFTSLTSDRMVPLGGYRVTTTVLADTELRNVMLQDARNELERTRRKYAILTELASVWQAIDADKERQLPMPLAVYTDEAHMLAA